MFICFVSILPLRVYMRGHAVTMYMTPMMAYVINCFNTKLLRASAMSQRKSRLPRIRALHAVLEVLIDD
jgi:hypothetical protein